MSSNDIETFFTFLVRKMEQFVSLQAPERIETRCKTCPVQKDESLVNKWNGSWFLAEILMTD